MSKNVEQIIKDVMAVVLNIDAGEINDDTSVDNTPGWDSANHINLVLALEEELSISFEVTELPITSERPRVHATSSTIAPNPEMANALALSNLVLIPAKIAPVSFTPIAVIPCP